MVLAWYMDEEATDPRLEHKLDPPQYIDLDRLFEISGVEYFKLNSDTYNTDGVLDEIRKKRGYSYEDEITCSEKCMPDLDKKLKIFYEEHLHTDEEIRFVLDGSGYFDVRDKEDKWIRIKVERGDLLIIPSGIYHRFTLDMNMYIKAKRYFVGEPVWIPHNRPADHLPCRQEYNQKLSNGFVKPT